MSSLASLSVLCVVSPTLFLSLSFILSLVGFLFLLECSRSARFSFYIIGFDKQSYVELVTNQYRWFVSLI